MYLLSNLQIKVVLLKRLGNPSDVFINDGFESFLTFN